MRENHDHGRYRATATPASIEAAQARALNAYVAAQISAETLGSITSALSTRMAALECLAAVV